MLSVCPSPSDPVDRYVVHLRVIDEYAIGSRDAVEDGLDDVVDIDRAVALVSPTQVNCPFDLDSDISGVRPWHALGEVTQLSLQPPFFLPAALADTGSLGR